MVLPMTLVLFRLKAGIHGSHHCCILFTLTCPRRENETKENDWQNDNYGEGDDASG